MDWIGFAWILTISRHHILYFSFSLSLPYSVSFLLHFCSVFDSFLFRLFRVYVVFCFVIVSSLFRHCFEFLRLMKPGAHVNYVTHSYQTGLISNINIMNYSKRLRLLNCRKRESTRVNADQSAFITPFVLFSHVQSILPLAALSLTHSFGTFIVP